MKLVKAKAPTRKAFSERMLEYGEVDKKFVVLESDIGYSTFSYLFGESYPERYFNLGIAEQNTMAAAAGFAASDRTAVVCGYGVFVTMRALEMIRSFICYPNLNVKFLSSHGGLTAAIDGVTHQATEDIAIMSTLPNMKVLVPACPGSARKLFEVAMETPGPVFTRLMRETFYELYDENEDLKLGGSFTHGDGKDITIVSYGDIVFQALEAQDELKKQGISAEVIDMYSVKPWDRESLLKSAQKTGAVLVVENHQARNGLGYEIATYLLKNNPVAFNNLGLQDCFAESGAYEKIIDKYGIAKRSIIEATSQLLKKKGR